MITFVSHFYKRSIRVMVITQHAKTDLFQLFFFFFETCTVSQYHCQHIQNKDLSLCSCSFVPELTFGGQIHHDTKHVSVSLSFTWAPFTAKLERFFWTPKFNMTVWCDRCENRSGWAWLMLSSQHCAMIETGITVGLKKAPMLTLGLV